MAGTTRCTMDRGLRNVLVVSLGFLLLFTAYGGLQNLQVRGHGRRGVWDCRPCDSAKPSGTSVVSGGRPRADHGQTTGRPPSRPAGLQEAAVGVLPADPGTRRAGLGGDWIRHLCSWAVTG